MKKLSIVLMVLFFAILPFAADRTPQSHLLISEVAVTSNSAEYVEIYNPTDYAIDLSNVYLTDATNTSSSYEYYNIVTGSNQGGLSGSDFHVKFPFGATIDSHAYIVVAMRADYFSSAWGFDADYEVAPHDSNVPDMVDVSGDITPDPNPGLSDSGEVVIMYYWDGQSDLVKDLDYFVWGDKAEAIDKTGVAIDGLDAGSDTSTYANDTSINSQVAQIAAGYPDLYYYTFQRTDFTESTENKNCGGNGIFGDDETSENLLSAFTIGIPTPGAAYDTEDYYGYYFAGLVESAAFPYEYYNGVPMYLYSEGTTLNDMLFGIATPVATTTSDTSMNGYKVNFLFSGLTEGTTYTIFAWGNGRIMWNGTDNLYATANSGTFYRYLKTMDTITTTAPADNTVLNDGNNITFSWNAYSDSHTGDTPDNYELRIYDGTTVNTYTTANTSSTQTLPEGDYKWVVLGYSSANGYFAINNSVKSLKVTHFIDKVVLVDTNNIKVYFTAPLDSLGVVNVDGVAPIGTNFTAGNNWAEFEFTNAFTLGNTYTLNMASFQYDGNAYSESKIFDAELTYLALNSADIITNSQVQLTFSDAVSDISTDTSDFTISPSLTISSIAVDGNIVDVYLSDNIVKGTNYTITANVKDARENDIDPAHNSATFVLNVTYPEITKAEMIDRQTVKIYFNKEMSEDNRAFGYVQDPWLYTVCDEGYTSYIFTNYVEYNSEDKTALIHVESAIPVNQTMLLDASGLYYYFGGAWPLPSGINYYPTDKDGYTVFQSGKYFAKFSTKMNDLEQVYTYPSPATSGSITFTNLAGSGTISIYTINGVKIDDIDFDNEVEKTVDLKTPSGKEYVNGVYLYRIKSDKGTKTGSFAVLK